VIEARTNAGKEMDKVRKKMRCVSNMTAAHKQISAMLDRWVLKNFRSLGGSVGGWKPFAVYCVGGPRSPYNKTKTCGRGRVVGVGQRRKLDTSAKLLQDTGRLRLSFKPFATQRTAGIGSDLPYSEPHEKGKGPLPKRRMLPNDEDVKKDVINIYKHFIEVKCGND